MTEPGLGGLFLFQHYLLLEETKKQNKHTKMRHWCCLRGVLKPWVEVLNEAGSKTEISI